MDLSNKTFIFLKLAFLLQLLGCGVKGKPMPPLVPPPIGRGEPVYSGATTKKAPIVNKYNYKLEEESDEDNDSSGE